MTNWKLVATIRHKLAVHGGAGTVGVPANWLKELLDKFEKQEQEIADLKEAVGRRDQPGVNRDQPVAMRMGRWR